MSRQSVMPQRNLTLTEELERLEQSITLTLQEIDHNFSKAHRIVTSSIIPIVEQYAKHSDAVWDGSKFWKQFFEASANVSLSSYEEAPEEEDVTAVGQAEEASEGQDFATPAKSEVEADDTVTMTEERPASRYDETRQSGIMDSPSVTIASRGTPARKDQAKANGKGKQRSTGSNDEASFAQYPSPYESLKAEVQRNTTQSQPRPHSRDPQTPGKQTASNFDSSPVPVPPSTTQHQPSALRQGQNRDRLLHTVLDKNYRLQATPHTARRKGGSKSTTSPQKSAQATATKTQQQSKPLNPALDSSPFSPGSAAPQLRREIFGSPAAGKASRRDIDRGGPRTPGLSVQKTARYARPQHGQRTPRPAMQPSEGAGAGGLFSPSPPKQSARRQGQPPASAARTTPANDALWTSSDEEDDLHDPLGMSPPKTMQFHIPQNRLVQTPAREASKRIVEDLLMSAGVPDSTTDSLEQGVEDLELDLGFDDDEDEGRDGDGGGVEGEGRGGEEASPSVVRARGREEDGF